MSIGKCAFTCYLRFLSADELPTSLTSEQRTLAHKIIFSEGLRWILQPLAMAEEEGVAFNHERLGRIRLFPYCAGIDFEASCCMCSRLFLLPWKFENAALLLLSTSTNFQPIRLTCQKQLVYLESLPKAKSPICTRQWTSTLCLPKRLNGTTQIFLVVQ